MSKTTNKFAPEVRKRAVRMVFGHERDHPSRLGAVVWISGKVGCSAYTLDGGVDALRTMLAAPQSRTFSGYWQRRGRRRLVEGDDFFANSV